MPIAVAILAASQQISQPISNKTALIGEVGLYGIIRLVRGVVGMLLAWKQAGLSHFVIPVGYYEQARMISNIQLTPIDTLQALYIFLSKDNSSLAYTTGKG